MANFSKMFQEEVRRLARKEAKIDLDRIKKENVELRRAISQARKHLVSLRKTVIDLARDAKAIGVAATRSKGTSAAAAIESEEGADRSRISSKTIATLRTKLGLTQGEFAKLIGVTGQSVYQWERKGGQLTFRGGAKERIVAIKGIGAREARKRLEENIKREQKAK